MKEAQNDSERLERPENSKNEETANRESVKTDSSSIIIQTPTLTDAFISMLLQIVAIT